MVLKLDLISQIHLAGAEQRYRESAAERERVQEQLAVGMSPAKIETPDRVQLRAQRLGCEGDSAARFTAAAQGYANTRDTAHFPNPQNVALERLIGGSDLLSSAFLERGAQCSQSVCCIRRDHTRIGTGFLVCPRVLLTNAHVIGSQTVGSLLQAEFNYEDKVDTLGTEESVVFRLRPEELFISSPPEALDYTLIAVEPMSNAKNLADFGFLQLDATVGKVLRGEALNIIQHPNGAPKRVAIRQNRFTALLENFMHYEADTLPGSSGAPVFNDQWQVVCLHHAGVPLKDSHGRILTKDNQLWTDGDSPALIKWIGNEGVRISRIIADVERHPKRQHPLLKELPRPAKNPPNSSEQLMQTMPLNPSAPVAIAQSLDVAIADSTPAKNPIADSNNPSAPLPVTIRITLG